MARLALINPPASLEQRYGDLASAGSRSAPLGLCALAAAARCDGHEVRIFDGGLCSDPAALATEVRDYRPALIGFTAVTMTVGAAARVAGILGHEVPLIIGGPHVSAVAGPTLARYPHFTAAVAGEGEPVLTRLLSALDDGASVRELSLDGLFTARSETGQQVSGPRLMDLDRLPFPAFDLLPGFPHRYRPQAPSVNRMPSVSVITSRGCPGRCTFCSGHVFGRRIAMHSAAYVAELLGWLHSRFGIRDVQFEDDCFLLSPQRVLDLCRLIRNRRLDLSWSCLARADQLDRALVGDMKAAGCRSIQIGIESGNGTVLERLNKGVGVEQIRSAVQTARSLGLRVKGFIMVGCPGESEDTLAQTERLVLSSGVSDIGICYFTPYPGTEDAERCPAEGQTEGDWDAMSGYGVTFIPTGMTESGLRYWYRRIWQRFYLRPRVILDYIRRLTSWSQLACFLRGFLALVRIRGVAHGR